MSIWLLLKATHVVGAIMLIGPAFGYGIIAAMGQKEPQHRGFANKVVGVLDKRMFKPGLALVIASGLIMGLMTVSSKYGSVFTEGWLIASLAIVALSLIYSYTFHRSNQKQIGQLARQAAMSAEPDPSLEAQIVVLRRRLKIGGKVIAYSYGVVAALMVLKPF